MKLGISKITSAINKIYDLTSGDKSIPGVLFRPNKEENKLSVCYYDGHKAFVEEIEAVYEDNDKLDDFVVDFDKIHRAILNCQPSGIIKVSEVEFKFISDSIVRVSAEQFMEVADGDGNVSGTRKMANKKIDLKYVNANADMKSSLLTRMKYDTIFEPDDSTDEYDKSEFIDALGKTSIEKNKNIYISANVQQMFVSNQAHVTAVPVKGFEVTLEDMDNIRAELVEKNQFTEEKYQEEIKNYRNRVHQSVVLGQSVAKSLIGILNKCKADKVLLHKRDKFCNLMIDTDEEKVGIWFEMPVASKAALGALERYNSLGYKTYQMMFFREFLDNNIKSALNATKSEKVVFSFEDTEIEDAVSDIDLVIGSANSVSSMTDVYRVNPDDYISLQDDLKTKTFSVSLKVFSDMLSQLKTEYVALDINIGEADSICIRLAEVDREKMAEEYVKAREKTAEICSANGVEFDPNSTPTDVETKLNYRVNILKTKQYTMLAK